MTAGASSVVGGGKLLLNTAFPRLLMPLSAVRTSFFRFLPTLAVYAVIHLLAGNPVNWRTPLALIFLAMVLIFAAGVAMIFAAVQVYFRDTSSFLPYIVRIWLYLSPVLWFAEQAPGRLKQYLPLNPLYSLLGGWSDLLVRGQLPPASFWLAGAAWALTSVLLGALFFMSREREFAVRL
jgi:teichoic acid transport system permease protein